MLIRLPLQNRHPSSQTTKAFSRKGEGFCGILFYNRFLFFWAGQFDIVCHWIGMCADGCGRCTLRYQFCHNNKSLCIRSSLHTCTGRKGQDMIFTGNRNIIVLHALRFCFCDYFLEGFLVCISKVYMEALPLLISV